MDLQAIMKAGLSGAAQKQLPEPAFDAIPKLADEVWRTLHPDAPAPSPSDVMLNPYYCD